MITVRFCNSCCIATLLTVLFTEQLDNPISFVVSKRSKISCEYECSLTTYDKLKALELLGRHLGMFNDKVKVEGTVPVVLYDDIPPE